MTNTLTKSWHKMRSGPLVLGAVTFGRWWWHEIMSALPEAWRGYLDRRPERLLARVRDEQVLMWRDGNGGEELARFRLSDDPADAHLAVQGAISHFQDERPHTFILLEENQVLCKRLTLPAAAGENLRQVLAFEMDRHTPFKADDVRYDYRLLATNPDTRALRVELIVAKRTLVDRLVGAVRERGLELDGVDVCRERDDRVLAVLGVNLLAKPLRARRSRRQLKLNLAFAGLFVGLLYAVMWQSLAAKGTALLAFEAKTEAASLEAREVRRLSEQLDEARAAARFLGDKKASHPSVMQLLMELTRLLPDEVWLQRLQITDSTVTITGQAGQAQTLLGLLQNSTLLHEPAIRGPITPDPQSGKERFTIEARSRREEEKGDGATAAGQR